MKSAEHALCPGLHSYVRGRAGETATASKHFRSRRESRGDVTGHVLNEGLTKPCAEPISPSPLRELVVMFTRSEFRS